jgi:copper chaperone CopZ
MTMKTTSFSVPDIMCGGCASAIQKALGSTEGVSQVNVDVAAKTVTVTHDDKATPEAIALTLDRAGFRPA